MDKNESIAEIEADIRRTNTELARMLTRRGQFVTAAESLTGGMICSSFVDIPGSSDWFSDGFVTYSNEAKIMRLGVPYMLISKHTAVSSEVAMAMAQGALHRSGADYAVAVTGLAGPFEDENGVPYPMDPRHERGLVFVAAAYAGGACVRRCVFSGNRTEVRKKTNRQAVIMLKKLVQSAQQYGIIK